MQHRREREHDRWREHVPGAAEDARESIGEPHRRGAGEQQVRVRERFGERRVLAAEQPVDRRAAGEHQRGEHKPERGGEDDRVHRQPAGEVGPPGAERARDRRRDAAAHRAGGGHLQQHHEREDEREAGQRRRPEPADEDRVADADGGLERDQHHAGQGEPRDRRDDGRGEQPFGAGRVRGGHRPEGSRRRAPPCGPVSAHPAKETERDQSAGVARVDGHVRAGCAK